MKEAKNPRTKMTVREAIKLYPDLLDEPIENMHYSTEALIPPTAVFQLAGNGGYRSKYLKRKPLNK